MQPKVSIILVNYNQAEVTRDCLHSLNRISYPNYEILLVDNASNNNERIAAIDFPSIKLIQSEENLGEYATTEQSAFAACNYGC